MTEKELDKVVEAMLALQDQYDQLQDQLVAGYKRIIEGVRSLGRKHFVAEVNGATVQTTSTNSNH